jgi:hypothetical protein
MDCNQITDATKAETSTGSEKIEGELIRTVLTGHFSIINLFF